MFNNFFSFKEKYQLSEVEKKIETWDTLQFFEQDMFSYLAFIRKNKESLGCGFQRDSDPTFHTLCRWWKAEEDYTEVDIALASLSSEEQEAFLNLYLHNSKVESHGYSKENILVRIASKIPSYTYHSVIEEEYAQFVKEQDDELRLLKNEMKKRLPETVKKFQGQFWDLFSPAQLTQYLTGATGNCRQKREQIVLTALFFEGQIGYNTLKQQLSNQRGGQKLLNRL